MAEDRKVESLGKWLWVLFWLVVPSTLANVMTNENIAGLVPELVLPGYMLSIFVLITYGLILLKLASVEKCFQMSGICTLIATGISGGYFAMSMLTDDANWISLLTIPSAIVSFVGEYYECAAYSAVLLDVDECLARKWSLLWKWFVAVSVTTIGGTCILFFTPPLGMIAILAGTLGMVVVDILKLVYLYQSAKRFRTVSDGSR